MKSKQYLQNLTPLRGIAALLTLVFHAEIFLSFIGGSMLIDPSKSSLLSGMYIMVDFFFVLSGFILCYVYADYFIEGFNTQKFKTFFAARFARIYPMHFFSLCLTAGIWGIAGSLGFPKFPLMQIENSVYSFVTNLFLLHSMNFHHWFTFTHASWSISTEWWMYMLFPFIAMPILKLPKQTWILIVAFCIGLYLLIEFVLRPEVTIPLEISVGMTPDPQPNLNVSFQYGFFRCMAGFVLGMATYLVFTINWAKSILATGWVLIIEVFGIFLCLHFNVNDLAVVLFFPFVLLTAAYGNSSFNAFFESKPLQKLGDWSYSIYLIHQPFLILFTLVMLIINRPEPGKTAVVWSQTEAWMVLFGFIAFSLFVSWLAYRFFEVPMRNWLKKKLSPKQK